MKYFFLLNFFSFFFAANSSFAVEIEDQIEVMQNACSMNGNDKLDTVEFKIETILEASTTLSERLSIDDYRFFHHLKNQFTMFKENYKSEVNIHIESLNSNLRMSCRLLTLDDIIESPPELEQACQMPDQSLQASLKRMNIMERIFKRMTGVSAILVENSIEEIKAFKSRGLSAMYKSAEKIDKDIDNACVLLF